MDVLIVERDELFSEVLSDALSADGISVAIVPNEEEAMRACRDGSPRVVITGINRRFEDMKGLYFARAMRVHCPWLAVVFMAALRPVKLHQCGSWYPGAVPHQAGRHGEIGAHRSRASGSPPTSMMYHRFQIGQTIATPDLPSRKRG